MCPTNRHTHTVIHKASSIGTAMCRMAYQHQPLTPTVLPEGGTAVMLWYIVSLGAVLAE